MAPGGVAALPQSKGSKGAVSASRPVDAGCTKTVEYGDSMLGGGPLGSQQRDNGRQLDLPPEIAAAMQRSMAFLGRIFNPAVLFEPLPPELRYSLQRNFGFFTRIFTQFVDHREGRNVRESLPFLAKGRPT